MLYDIIVQADIFRMKTISKLKLKMNVCMDSICATTENRIDFQKKVCYNLCGIRCQFFSAIRFTTERFQYEKGHVVFLIAFRKKTDNTDGGETSPYATSRS